MPFTTPTAQEFRGNFPEFSDSDQFRTGVITRLLTEAEGGVGTDWAERDYQPALMYLAAHYLQSYTDQQASIAASSSGGSGSSDGLGMVKSITTGNRTVTFETKASTEKSNSGDSSDINDFMTTFYGQQYLRLLRRNVLGVLTLNAG